MNKQEFLKRLREGLSEMSEEDIAERLTFYGEMIDEGVEDGMTEEEATERIGSVDETVKQIKEEQTLGRPDCEKAKPKRSLRAWEIVLVALGSPIWLSLLIAAFSVLLAVYIVMWSLIISLWAVELSFAVCSVAGAVLSVVSFAARSNAVAGVAMLGACLFCAGCAILLFFGCLSASRGILKLSKLIILKLKMPFIKGEGKK